MAGSGSAWIKPKKRTGLRPARMAERAHPRFVRAGQRYFPAQQRGKSRATIKIVRPLAGDAWAGVRDDGRRVRLAAARLLATNDDGQGRYYRFVGYASRRYDTHGLVVETGSAWTRLVVPEWHPSLTVNVGTGVLSPVCRRVGAWVRCRANLGAQRPAHLELDRIVTAEADLDPERYAPVTIEPTAPLASVVLPASGPGCGDIVLFVSASEGEALARGRTDEVYVTGHSPPVTSGGRVYLHTGTQLLGWRRLGAKRLRPNGTSLLVEGPWQPCSIPVACALPPSDVARGEHGRQRWIWRSWPREWERTNPIGDEDA